MTKVNPSQVFLSYSRRDTPIAAALERDLESLGLSVWMDRHDISVGERWSAAIQEALEQSHAMVLVISPDSMASANVQDEFTYFLDHKKPIVPVMVREARLQFQLHRLQWIDFTGGGTDLAYKELIKALHDVGVAFPEQETITGTLSERSVVAQLLEDLNQEKKQARRTQRLMTLIATLLVVIVGAALLGFAAVQVNDYLAPPPTPTPPSSVLGTIDSGGLRVPMYLHPSRDAVVVTELEDDSPIIIRQRTPDDRFYQAQFGLSRGWVLARDVAAAPEVAQLTVYLSPTPSPSPSPTEFVTPIPSPSPSPTPEQVEPGVGGCVVQIAADSEAKLARLTPSLLGFSEFDRVFPNESFIATARSGFTWLYTEIGWLQREPGILLQNEAACDSLPENADLRPQRFRQFIKDLGIVAELRQGSLESPRPLPTDNLDAAALPVATTWNRYATLLETLAQLLSVDQTLLTALVVPEATLTGSDEPDNRYPIYFEAGVFEQHLTKEQEVEFALSFRPAPDDPTRYEFRADKTQPYSDFHQSTAAEWAVFEWALGLNPEAAYRALRYGPTGVLGNNFYLMGFSSPQQMFQTLMDDPTARVIARLDYVRSQAGALNALRALDWSGFGNLYNAGGTDWVGQQVAQETSRYFYALLPLL